MSFTVILNIVLALLSKREELTKLVTEAIALFKALGIDFGSFFEESTEPTQFTVEWLQESLNTLMDAGLVVDGDYGNATKEAVKKFQEAHGLTVDGWCGVLTQAAIVQALKE